MFFIRVSFVSLNSNALTQLSDIKLNTHTICCQISGNILPGDFLCNAFVTVYHVTLLSIVNDCMLLHLSDEPFVHHFCWRVNRIECANTAYDQSINTQIKQKI